jgi:hypothetical protein
MSKRSKQSKQSKLSKQSKKSKVIDKKDVESEGSEENSESEGSESETKKTKSQKTKTDGNSVEAERSRVVNEIDLLRAKTNEQIFEEFLDFIECHDQIAYRKKIKGFRLAFNIRDKNYRIPESTLKKEMKPKNRETAEEIKTKVQEMKANRIEMMKSKEMKEQLKYKKNRNLLKKMHDKFMTAKYGGADTDPNFSYMGLKNKLLGAKINERHAKVDMDVLKRMHYSDFNLGDDDDFKPSDIIDEDDDGSDDSILKEYKAKPDVEASLPQEITIVSKNNANTYDEKVVNIKQHIKSHHKVSSRENKHELDQIRASNQSNIKNKDQTMIQKYRGGRNVSQIHSKGNLQGSYLAYPPPGGRLRNNNSVSKISQSMDMNPARRHDAKTILASNAAQRGTTKASDGKKMLLQNVKQRRRSILNSQSKDKTGKNKTNRNAYAHNTKVGDTRTERGILKMLDKQIDKGLKVAGKKSNYHY